MAKTKPKRKTHLVIQPGTPRAGVYGANRILKALIPQLIAVQDRQENCLVDGAAAQIDHALGQLRVARVLLRRAAKALKKEETK